MSARRGRLVATLRHELERTNFHGRTVTLAEGVAVSGAAAALAALARRPADAAVLGGIGALGLADDLVEHRQRRAGRPVAKGLRGHVRALAAGRPTTGGLKLVGIPVLCLAGAARAEHPRLVLVDAALTAGCANLANLLDLRPGRALKASLMPAALLATLPVQDGGTAERAAGGRTLAIAALLPALAALPVDLDERGMLGDAGANVLGAAVGTALARRTPPGVRIALLAGVVALTVASERVSFSAVIARTPWLERLDRIGRRADGPDEAGPA